MGQCQTVSGLAIELELAPATVRRHLDILQRDGMLKFDEKRVGAGRPEHVYQLTAKGFESGPREYDRLLIEMVNEVAKLPSNQIAGKSGDQVIEQVFESMADRIAHVAAADDTRPPMEKLMELLEERHYEPKLSTDKGTTRIQLNNCPYRSAAIANPIICSFDSRLISSVLGTDSSRSECVRDGDGCCLYEVSLSGDSTSPSVQDR
ncbi:MAG: ArsR family transcriptional regulator [Chloroflexi bacterium]|nr:ArsR family transcriptional regulator [Chloroflexota bacterium]